VYVLAACRVGRIVEWLRDLFLSRGELEER